MNYHSYKLAIRADTSNKTSCSVVLCIYYLTTDPFWQPYFCFNFLLKSRLINIYQIVVVKHFTKHISRIYWLYNQSFNWCAFLSRGASSFKTQSSVYFSEILQLQLLLFRLRTLLLFWANIAEGYLICRRVNNFRYKFLNRWY